VYDQNKITINKFNKHTFDKWSNKMSYLLGLLYSDGNISYTINSGKIFKRTSFSQKDKVFMNKVVKLFEFDGKLNINKKTDVLNMVMHNNYMVEKLEELGLYPNKSLTVKFPNIPEKYLSHFIRGLFDGDGCICKIDGTISFVVDLKNLLMV